MNLYRIVFEDPETRELTLIEHEAPDFLAACEFGSELKAADIDVYSVEQMRRPR